MSRRHKSEPHANHERWLISYADFITLLFAFFVVMFASGQTDKQKAKQVAQSVREGLEESSVQAALDSILSNQGARHDLHPAAIGNPSLGPAKPPPKAEQKPSPPHPQDLAPTYASLSAALQHEIDSGEMKVSLQPRGLTISLRQSAFFPSGGDRISPAMRPSLEKLAIAIRSLPNLVRLEGHTDSQPIHSARFHSNWELSAARSIAMLVEFTDSFSLPENRFVVAGYADTVPVDDNESDTGRAHNRRVDIVILNQATE